jgi:hypothetical protein
MGGFVTPLNCTFSSQFRETEKIAIDNKINSVNPWDFALIEAEYDGMYKS